MTFEEFESRIETRFPDIIIRSGADISTTVHESFEKICNFVGYGNNGITGGIYKLPELCYYIENMTDEEYEWLKL